MNKYASKSGNVQEAGVQSKDARKPHELRKNGRAHEAWENRKRARNDAAMPQDTYENEYGKIIRVRTRAKCIL